MSDFVVMESRADRAFYLRPHVVVAARGRTTVARADWEEWLASQLDSPLLPFLGWPGKADVTPPPVSWCERNGVPGSPQRT